MAEPLPDMQPLTVAGQRVGPVPQADGTIPRTRRSAFGSAFRFGNDFVLDRWTGLFEEPEAITEDEFQEVVGEAPISFFQGMSRRQAERRLAEYEYQQWEQQFESFPLTQFAGMGVPFLYDPGTIATLPVGASNIARMATVPTMRQALLQGAIGGGKVSLASAPLEVGLQVQQTGGVDPVIAGLSTAAPFVAVPAFGFLGRGVRALAGVRDGPLTHQIGKRSEGRLSPANASKLADEVGDLPAPPTRVHSSEIPVPRARLDEMFQPYPGGRVAWLRDMSAGRTEAQTIARTLNIDPEAPSIRELLLTMQDRSAQTSRTPIEHNVRTLDAVNLFRAGDRSREVVDRLVEEGLVMPRVRVVDGVVQPTGEVALSATGRLLDEALVTPTAPANRQILNEVTHTGTGALDRLARRRGVDLDPETNPNASPHRVAAAEVGDDEVIKALEAARLQTADARPGASGRPVQQQSDPASPPAGRTDPDLAELEAAARRIGSDLDDINALGTRVLARITECGGGA